MHDQTTHGTLFNSFWNSRFRATSCTLRHRELHIEQVARYAWHHELRIKVNHSCNKLHATREDSIRIAYGFYSQTLGGYNKSVVRFWKIFKNLTALFYYLRKPPFIFGGICTMLSGDFMFDYLLGDCIKRKKSLSGFRMSKLSELAKLLS